MAPPIDGAGICDVGLGFPDQWTIKIIKIRK
jgi:hypothetical protein